MFTGIITHTSKVIEIDLSQNKLIIVNKFNDLSTGMSICVDGACMTVSNYDKRSITFVLSEETISRTIIKNYKKNALVNLELPVKNDSLFSGHIVLGHVDDTGTINEIKVVKNNLWDFYLSTVDETYIIDKGSITINGISLTTNLLSDKLFYVSIIPETFNNTNLMTANENDEVNIEYDIIGKYVYKFSK